LGIKQSDMVGRAGQTAKNYGFVQPRPGEAFKRYERE
jgi:hypothetical protein